MKADAEGFAVDEHTMHINPQVRRPEGRFGGGLGIARVVAAVHRLPSQNFGNGSTKSRSNVRHVMAGVHGIPAEEE